MNAVEFNDIREGYTLPESTYSPSMQQLFLYAASTWNAHRIHYDHVYTTKVECYENLVVQGPLIADFFTQHIISWLAGRGKITAYKYSNRSISFLGDKLVAKAKINYINNDTGVMEIEGYIENIRGDIVLPGHVTVELIRNA